jgi:hypothetical protein
VTEQVFEVQNLPDEGLIFFAPDNQVVGVKFMGGRILSPGKIGLTFANVTSRRRKPAWGTYVMMVYRDNREAAE